MMEGRVNIKEIIIFAGTYISICIGSGFATGQEIMQFFSAHGMISILSSIVCMVLMAYCGGGLLGIGKVVKLKNSNDIFKYLCGKHIGGFFRVFMPIFFFATFIVMISGAGASINQYYGLDKNVGSIIMSVIALISVLLGIKKVINILGNLGPIIAFIAIGIGLITFLRNIDNLKNVNDIIRSLNINKAVNNWWMTSVIYTGLNLIIATPFLVGAGATATNKKNCIMGGILGGIVFVLAALALNLGIMSDISNLYIREIPTLYMASSIGPILGTMFSIILVAGIYTTAVPLLWSVSSTFGEEGSKEFIIVAILSTIIGTILSRLPFSMLVNIIYPISGVFGVIIMIAIILRSIKNGIYYLFKGYII